MTAFLAARLAAPGGPAASVPGGYSLRRTVEQAVKGLEGYLALAEQAPPSPDLAASRAHAEQLWAVLERAAALWDDSAGPGADGSAPAADRAADAGDPGRASVTRRMLEGRVLVYRISGELDMDSAELIGFDDAAAHASHLLLDLAELAFCDSAGLNALLRLRLAAVERGIPVRLVAISDRVARLLEVTGADQVFPVDPSLDEALTALA